MNKKFLLLIAGILALFSACSDNVVLQDPEPLPVYPDLPPNISVKTTAKLSVLVTDAITGETLDADVTLLSTGVTVSADAVTGIAVFDSLYVGDYTLIIKKAGYASGVVATKISLINNATENILVASDKAELHELYPLTSGLSGYLFYEDAAGTKYPAEGAEVRIQFDDKFLDRKIEAEVNKDGKYTFKNLPAVGSNYKLFALEYTPDDITYKTLTFGTLPELLYGVTAYEKETAYSINDEGVSLFILTNYTKSVEYTDPVIFEFSDDIDTKLLSYDAVELSNGQVANITWDGNQLIIESVNEDGWTNHFDVIFNKKLTSVIGKSLSLSNQPVILNAPDLSGYDVRKFNLENTNSSKIDYSTNIVALKWNKVPSATGYNIYTKESNGSNEWYLAHKVGNGNDTATSVQVNHLSFENGGAVEFAVQAYNPSSQTFIDVTRAIEVSDNVKPSLIDLVSGSDYAVNEAYIWFASMSPYDFATAYLNSYLTSPPPNNGNPDVAKYELNFSEPMDTTVKLTEGWTNDLSGRLEMDKKWIDERTLELKLKIAGGPVLEENMTATYRLSGLIDKNKNSFEQDYEWADTKKSTVDFRFRVYGL